MKRTSFVMLALWAALCGSALAQTAAPTETTETLEATEDTWVDQADPTAAHGDEATLTARLSGGTGSRVLVGFDLDRLKGGQIRSAVLSLYLGSGSGASNVQIAASGIKAAWDEKTTWETQPERTATYPIVEVGVSAAVFEWDVTSLLQENIGLPGGLHGIALNGPVVGTGEGYERAFASSEGDKGPQLKVTYVPAPKQEESGPPPGSSQVRWVITGISAAAIAGVAVLLYRRRGRDGSI